MSNSLAAYYYGLTGAVGGVIGWFLGLFVLDRLSVVMPGRSELSTVVLSLTVGAAIGAAVGGRDRATVVNFKTGVRDAVRCGLLCAVAGALFSIPAYYMFLLFGQNLIGRMVAFMCLGAIVGASEGLNWIKEGGGRRVIRGAVGGALGGAIAAIIYHLVSSALSVVVGQAVAFLLLGFLLGAGISTACTLGHMAVLQVLDAPKGKLVGQLRPLGAYGSKDVIGRDPNASLSVITDDTLALRHAEILNKGREFFIQPLEGDQFVKGLVYLNGNPVRGETRLKGGDRINAGACLFEFNNLKDAKVVRGTSEELLPETDEDRKKARYNPTI